MKQILVISPHYPPSNLAAVHRSRLFAQHLPSFGWKPIILTVHEDYYEEVLDHKLEQLLPKGQRIEKVKAWRVSKPRLIGDIGLRAFFQLRKRAVQIVKQEQIDFVYIPIPSFYAALLGPYIKKKTGVSYGIDYIDPWVHKFPGSDHLFSRHWFSTQLAQFLEPKAVQQASLITGVAEGYYEAVLQRNPHLREQCVTGAMPYGGEVTDHGKIKELSLAPYLFKKNKKLQLVYAGAMLPKAYQPLEQILQVIAANRSHYEAVEFHFIGTGKTPNDADGFTIKPLAEKYGLWKTVVFEYPQRIPYLDVLTHLEASDAVFILGSTEPHYTPSKTYQGVLSGKPILAVLHTKSTAVEVVRTSNAGVVLDFNGEAGLEELKGQWMSIWSYFLQFHNSFNKAQVNQQQFEQYSAKAVTAKLASLLNRVIQS
ncbi:MAG: glycosyltransferase family 4 protein [Lacibacter sp.]